MTRGNRKKGRRHRHNLLFEVNITKRVHTHTAPDHITSFWAERQEGRGSSWIKDNRGAKEYFREINVKEAEKVNHFSLRVWNRSKEWRGEATKRRKYVKTHLTVREGHYMGTERSGYWQPVARETARVITRGQLGTQRRADSVTPGRAHGGKHEQGRVCLHASRVESRRKRSSRDRK